MGYAINKMLIFVVTVGCLVLHQRYKKRFEKYRSLSNEVSTDTSEHPKKIFYPVL